MTVRTALDIDPREATHRLGGRRGGRRDGRRLAEGVTSGWQSVGAAPIAEEPIVTNAHPATGQGMQQLCGEVNYVARMTQMTILP